MCRGAQLRCRLPSQRARLAAADGSVRARALPSCAPAHFAPRSVSSLRPGHCTCPRPPHLARQHAPLRASQRPGLRWPPQRCRSCSRTPVGCGGEPDDPGAARRARAEGRGGCGRQGPCQRNLAPARPLAAPPSTACSRQAPRSPWCSAACSRPWRSTRPHRPHPTWESAFRRADLIENACGILQLAGDTPDGARDDLPRWCASLLRAWGLAMPWAKDVLGSLDIESAADGWELSSKVSLADMWPLFKLAWSMPVAHVRKFVGLVWEAFEAHESVSVACPAAARRLRARARARPPPTPNPPRSPMRRSPSRQLRRWPRPPST